MPNAPRWKTGLVISTPTPTLADLGQQSGEVLRVTATSFETRVRGYLFPTWGKDEAVVRASIERQE